jgi:hypothetical protein
MSHELFLGYDNNSLFLELFINYTQDEKNPLIAVLKKKETTRNILSLPQLPFLITKDGNTINELFEIAEFISRVGGNYITFYGVNENQVKATREFIKKISEINQNDELIKFLN